MRRKLESVGDPIEAYIDRLKARLLARFDADSVDRVVDEVRAHLSDSAGEIAERGCPTDLAAELAIARFGPAERSPLIPSLMSQIGAGDRFWGRVALAVAAVGAAALSAQAMFAAPAYRLEGQGAANALCVLLLLFGYASIRARALVPMRAMLLSVMSVIAISVLIDGDIDEGESMMAREALPQGNVRPLLVANWGACPTNPFDDSLATLTPDFGVFLAADSGTSLMGPTGSGSLPDQRSPRDAIVRELPPIAGFWDGAAGPDMVSIKGWISESARLATVWLALLLIAQACIAWLVGLDRAQRSNGLGLVM